MPRLLLRPPPLARWFFRISLFRAMIGVSLNGRAICCAVEECPLLSSAPPPRSRSAGVPSGDSLSFPGSSSTSSCVLVLASRFDWRMDARFLGTISCSSSSRGAGETSWSKLAFLLADVLLGAGTAAREALAARAGGSGVGSDGGGDRARFVLLCFGGLPTLFFAIGAGAATGSGSGCAGVVLTLLEPRVN